MIKNRTLSLAVIIMVYVITVFAGIYAYDYFRSDFSVELSLLFADIAATAVVFLFSLIFGNASVYDPYWSVQPPVILGVTLLRCSQPGMAEGSRFLGLLLFAVVLIWAVRLTSNWAYNFKSFEYQDWRYVMLKEKSGRAYPLINFLGIHLFPTVVVYFCILPAVTVVYTGAVFRPLCLFFVLTSLAAAIFQGIADIQMHKFRARKTGGFIRDGLWKHSRHPNYACEILMWWGVGLASVIAMPDKWYLLTGALVNTLMFMFISIPMADKRQSQKPGFDEYKKATRML